MKASYTKIFNLCNLSLILFLALLFVSGCQINQSVSILKEKLFSETDEVEKEEKEEEEKISRSLDVKKEDVKDSSIIEKLEKSRKIY